MDEGSPLLYACLTAGQCGTLPDEVDTSLRCSSVMYARLTACGVDSSRGSG